MVQSGAAALMVTVVLLVVLGSACLFFAPAIQEAELRMMGQPRKDGAYRRDPRERAVRRVAAWGRSHPSQRLRTPYSAVVREFRFLAAMHLTARVSAWTAPAT